MPAWARAPGRQVLVANADGVIVAGVRHELVASGDGTISAIVPVEAGIDRTPADRRARPHAAADHLRRRGRRVGNSARRRQLAFATVRSLPASNGEIAILHRRAEALAAWRSDTALTVTLSATTGFVVLILGFAFHWQATRAREADVIYETVRTPHRHRAQSRPLRIVGLGPRPRPHLLVALDVRDPRPQAAGRRC